MVVLLFTCMQVLQRLLLVASGDLKSQKNRVITRSAMRFRLLCRTRTLVWKSA